MFGERRQAEGTTRALTLEVAGASLVMESDDPSIALTVPTAASSFFREGAAAAADMRFEVRACDLSIAQSPKLPVFVSGGVWTLYEQDGGYLFSCESRALAPHAYKRAWLDRTMSHGHVELHRSNSEPLASYPLEYPLDELLLMHWLAEGRGVEVHGCGLIDPEKGGLLFAGHSGAGKTTTARLWLSRRTEATVLSDDRIVVRFESGRFWIYGTPWHGEARLAAAQRAPLNQIFLLRQAVRHALLSVPPSEAMSRLLACSFFPFHRKAALSSTLDLLQRIVQAVPCRELAFAPDEGVVDFVSGSI